jgi:hypothetical protein
VLAEHSVGVDNVADRPLMVGQEPQYFVSDGRSRLSTLV